ncbi:hypothetical protein V8E52_000896 [Russula decolorans]
MPALTTTHVIAQKRDGRAFDEVSDAVDEENQTVAFNIQARVDFKSRCRIWQAIEMTDSLVDESDPRGEDDRIISSSRKTQGHPLRLQTNAIPRNRPTISFPSAPPWAFSVNANVHGITSNADAKRRVWVGATWPNSGNLELESAHFVRQWWPTLPSVPRLSRTVVLLAQHHPHTHVTKYVLAQHYFTVPLQTQETVTDPNDAMMRIVAEEDEDTHEAPPRQRPLLAVDFGRAVWLEHVCAADEEEDDEPYERGQKRLRFVSFPGMRLEGEGHAMEGAARTLAIPKELDLHEVETINIDQSQGAVILSVRQGKIFILCYE